MFIIGANVRAIPKEEKDATLTHGTIIHIDQENNILRYYVKFNAPKDPRFSDWYYENELEYVGPPHAAFKMPKILEIRNIDYI